ncbi:unnamed protein product [Phytophthora fragariaefolia]|uniref:Unnamed protein product n=1 Tax=Phytophthora fragariaefolia TaxID=1490495 RepID=A0A9W7CYW6_9STRA|nr:unnamed protein product [Phytophthora fragariaefolia]
MYPLVRVALMWSAPAASAAANTVVASSATTGSSLASTPVVTSTVTTPSSPKRTLSFGEYKKARGNTVFARDELEALFDVGSDDDMEDGEEDEEISSSRRDDPSVGSLRPRKDDSDASSSKRSHSGSDRPLADAGQLSSPRSGGYSTPSVVVASRTAPVRDPWMPSPSEIQSRFGSTALPSQGAVEAGIPCAVPMGIACEHCHVGAVRVSERDINGYTVTRVPEELKALRTNLIAQMSSSAAGGRSTLWRAVGDYSSRSSFTPFGGFGGGGFRTLSQFPERPASGRSAAPRYRGSEAILSNEYENYQDLSSLDSPRTCATERNYPVHHKELLAIKYALAKFRVYPLGSRPFVVYTDHASLRTATKSPHISQRMARWLSCFAEYNFQVEYKPGRLNVVADALSRRTDYAVHQTDANTLGVERTSSPSSSLLDDVRSAYANDADAKQLLNYFAASADKSRQKLAKHLRARVHHRVHNGLLLYSAVDDNADRVVVLDDHELKLRITYEYHDAPTSGHPGREKTYLLLTRDFFWSHQYKWVRKYVRACEVCQRVKPAPFSQAPLQSLQTPSEC